MLALGRACIRQRIRHACQPMHAAASKQASPMHNYSARRCLVLSALMPFARDLLGAWVEHHCNVRQLLTDSQQPEHEQTRDLMQKLSDESTIESRFMFLYSEVFKPTVEKGLEAIGKNCPDKEVGQTVEVVGQMLKRVCADKAFFSRGASKEETEEHFKQLFIASSDLYVSGKEIIDRWNAKGQAERYWTEPQTKEDLESYRQKGRDLLSAIQLLLSVHNVAVLNEVCYNQDLIRTDVALVLSELRQQKKDQLHQSVHNVAVTNEMCDKQEKIRSDVELVLSELRQQKKDQIDSLEEQLGQEKRKNFQLREEKDRLACQVLKLKALSAEDRLTFSCVFGFGSILWLFLGVSIART
eukprot:Skav202934  [mRNA]  locus=scaffold422:72385:73449:+ [translate_table: standard]